MKISNEKELRQIYGFAKDKAKLKQLTKLEKHSINFIKKSPFVVISTSNLSDSFDCSPRGGEKGFVYVYNNNTILIPDLRGNNRLDSLVNLLYNSHVGCLFLIPGIDETLRLNGTAELRTDAELLGLFPLEKKPPKCVIKISIEEVFFHCPKALNTSRLWSNESKVKRSSFPSLNEIINDQLDLI